MKAEGSAGEVGPSGIHETFSGEVHADDNFSDDEPETELEALQHLPPEERRKALRRLRNRESARRVRARRLAEMSQMETSMRGIKEENSALKAHVNKLQNHIQSMTLKVYEVTSKYESAVAENAQLRAELQRLRRPSAPGESTRTASACAAAALAAASGPNSAPPQVSPFVNPCEDVDAAAAAHMLSMGHAQLRSSSPMDLQQQRQALEEVVMLLKEHKRRNQGAAQDRSGGSEIGSSGVVNAAASSFNNAHSPGSDAGMPCVLPMFGAGAAQGCNPGNETGPAVMSNLSYNGSGAGQMLGPSPVLGTSGPSFGASRAGQHDSSMMGHHAASQSQLPQQQPQQHMLGMSTSAGPSASGGGGGHCQVAMACSTPINQLPSLSQVQQIQQQILAKQATAAAAAAAGGGISSLGGMPSFQVSQQQQQHSQQQQQHPCIMQSHSHPLPQMPQPHLFAGQQQLQLMGGGVLQQGASAECHSTGYNSVASLSAPFLTAAAGLQVSTNGITHGQSIHGQQQQQQQQLQVAGMGPLGCTGGGMLGGSLALNQQQHKSASFLTDRGAGNVAFPSGGFMMHGGWQGGFGPNGAGAANVGLLRPEDIPEDIYMSLDDYLPQDL